MKTKLITLLVTLSILMGACSVDVVTYQHWDFSNNVPVYKTVTVYQNGAKEPTITILNPYRQMTPRIGR